MPARERPTYGAAAPRLDDVAAVDTLPLDDDADVKGVLVRGLRAAGLDLTGRRLTDVTFDGCDLAALTLQSADLVRVRFVDCRLTGMVAPELRGVDVSFERCALVDGWLRGAVLERADLIECDATGADLYGASLAWCRILDGTLDGAELATATFDHVALHGTSLEGLQGHAALRGAVIDPAQLMSVALYALDAAGITTADREAIDPSTAH